MTMVPLIVTASICGREKNKDVSPYFPATKDEVIADGIKSYNYGSPQLHIHARNDEGTYTYDPAVFGEILDAFREHCPKALLQISLGGTYGKPEELLYPLLALKPDLATFAIQSDDEINATLLKKFDEYDVKPIVECFNLEQAKRAIKLFADGYLKAPLNIEFLYDDHNPNLTFEETAGQLLEFAEMCAKQGNINWSVCKALANDNALHSMAIALGGHCRAGLEDRQLYSDGSYVKASTELIDIPMQMSKLLGRPLATYEEAKQILGVE